MTLAPLFLLCASSGEGLGHAGCIEQGQRPSQTLRNALCPNKASSEGLLAAHIQQQLLFFPASPLHNPSGER